MVAIIILILGIIVGLILFLLYKMREFSILNKQVYQMIFTHLLPSSDTPVLRIKKEQARAAQGMGKFFYYKDHRIKVMPPDENGKCSYTVWDRKDKVILTGTSASRNGALDVVIEEIEIQKNNDPLFTPDELPKS
ncbi:MAG: hypothetical protein A2Y71_10190 [Bacteroidetes bacterium RBG_13_42_15]|nr:MAG: hypothetical protein A2Y71_10190 [Bacteroidetes bacterium RBG_13_42_15]